MDLSLPTAGEPEAGGNVVTNLAIGTVGLQNCPSLNSLFLTYVA